MKKVLLSLLCFVGLFYLSGCELRELERWDLNCDSTSWSQGFMYRLVFDINNGFELKTCRYYFSITLIDFSQTTVFLEDYFLFL